MITMQFYDSEYPIVGNLYSNKKYIYTFHSASSTFTCEIVTCLNRNGFESRISFIASCFVPWLGHVGTY